MRNLILFLLLVFISCNIPKENKSTNNHINDNLKVMSWNIQNLGKRKLQNDTILEYIAKTINSYDIIAIQEVSTDIYGAKAIAKIDAILDRMGSNWDYTISDPTEGDGKERYAYLFKPNRVKLKKAFLEKAFETTIQREPYLAIFEFKGQLYTFLNVHLVPSNKSPEKEVDALCLLNQYSGKNIILGDFNLSEKHTAFDCLEKSYKPCLQKEKTSLKMEVKEGEYLNKEYDNVFISTEVSLISKGVIHFYKDFPNLELARKISDHCPIFIEIK